MLIIKFDLYYTIVSVSGQTYSKEQVTAYFKNKVEITEIQEPLMASVTEKISDTKARKVYESYVHDWKQYLKGTEAAQKKCNDAGLKLTPEQCIEDDNKVIAAFHSALEKFTKNLRENAWKYWSDFIEFQKVIINTFASFLYYKFQM